MATYHYAIKVWYIGKDFAGSQRQPDQRTVETELIAALIKRGYINSEKEANFTSAVRTDASVHARSAVYRVTTIRSLILGELDAFLPDDMGVWAYSEVNADFQPRYQALHKIYYYIYPKFPRDSIDFGIMLEATKKLIGFHDFTLLSKTNSSNPEKNPNIEIMTIEISENPAYFIFKFQARSFLWQLIRRTVAFLLAIGRKEKNIADLDAIFEQNNINNPNYPRIAPESPDGLILWQIEYDPSIKFIDEPKCIARMKKRIIEYTRSLLRMTDTFTFFEEKISPKP